MGLILVFLAIVAVIIFYRLIISRRGDLESSGIAHDKPLPVVGNIWPILSGSEGVVQYLERNYWKFSNEKIYSFYQLMGTPTVVPRDPAIKKQMMVHDFDYFSNRQLTPDFEIDRLLSKSVLWLTDQKWHDMRTMLSPFYSSSNMKHMYGLLIESMEDFTSIYEKKTEQNGGKLEIDTHDVFARITADGIATTALGFKGDCVVNKSSKIFKVAEDMETDFNYPLKMTLTRMFPKLLKLLGKQIFRKSIHMFFLTSIIDEMKRRREGKITRPDVIQLLVQAKEDQLKLQAGDAEEISYTESKINKISKWTDEDLAAQAVALFFSGFKTTATLMQNISYELSINPEIQQTLIDEVDKMLKTLGGKAISYDQLNQMKFLDMVVLETLRKRPPLRTSTRLCTKDYTIEDDKTGESFKIKKGTQIFLPVGAIQTDSKYFPDPEKFDPYRFSAQNQHKIVSGSFLTFGIGPRMCLGSRYALVEAKLLTFYILSKFVFEKTAKTPTSSKGNSGYNEKVYVTLKLRK